MPCPGIGPCLPYDLDLSCCLTPSGALPDPCILDGEPVAQGVIDNAILAASQILWAITGRQFSLCTVTIRPCRACADPCCLPWTTEFGFDGFGYNFGGFPSYPFRQADGSWINMSCPCTDNCSCVEICKIDLPSPVCSVDEVKIDGVIVDPSKYKVLNFEELVWADPVSGCWPRCNDLRKPDTEEGTWSVTLTYGKEPPQLVLQAAAEMACEIIKNCVGKPCRLPQRISSVTRQGVSVSFLDTMDFLDKGLTGLYFVDLAARIYNPHRLMRRPTVYSPDVANKWNLET